MLVNNVPDRKLFQNKTHVGHLKVHECGTAVTNRPAHRGKKSSRIGNVFKDVTTTDQIARVSNVLFSIEILDVADPRGGALQVRSLIARIEADPAIPAFLTEQGQEVSPAAAELHNFLAMDAVGVDQSSSKTPGVVLKHRGEVE